MECGMERRFHRGFTAAENTELWDRWKRGESRTSSGHPGMSQTCQTRKSPGSFNHLVGEQLKGVGHREAEGRGGLEINGEFVFERELNRQIARICPSQNLVHV